MGKPESIPNFLDRLAYFLIAARAIEAVRGLGADERASRAPRPAARASIAARGRCSRPEIAIGGDIVEQDLALVSDRSDGRDRAALDAKDSRRRSSHPRRENLGVLLPSQAASSAGSP